MKKRVVIVVMAALVICSCQVKEDGEFAPEGKPFTATMEAMADDATGVDTKTSMDSYGNVLWKQGDQVSIFAGSAINEHYQVTDASDGKTAAALNRVESPGFVAGGDIPNNVAYYPYAATAAIAKRSGGAYLISDISLPATQNYAESSFGNGAFPMTAVTSSTNDYNLKFKNVLGGLKLQLKGTAAITSISVTGNNNEKLCGAAEVTVSGDNAPAITLTDALAKTVTLDCGDGVQLNSETATAFIIALPPMTMSGGFTVTVTDTDGATMEIKTTKSQTITRSNLLSMPAVNYEGTAVLPQYVDLGLPSGLKWASCNLGASTPEEYGDYYAWGELEPKGVYSWSTYKFDLGNSDQGPFSKYVTVSSNGTVDNKTILDPEDDAAHIQLGGAWRIPTDAEFDELRTTCIWTWKTTSDGYANNGYLVTASNGNSIFLPAAGERFADGYNNPSDSDGEYWTSSLDACQENTDKYAFCRFFPSSAELGRGSSFRCFGKSIRPVTDEGVRVSVTGISLNKSSLYFVAGESDSLTATVTPSNATQPNVIWLSSNTSVATVDYTGKVTAVASGTTTITAKTYDGGFTATCTVTVILPVLTPTGTINGYGYVDLGLTSGLKWATFNVGASAPEEYGDYFAWGEIEPYYSSQNPLIWKEGKGDGYLWTSYKFCTSGDSDDTVKISKYNTISDYGPIDNKTILELGDDAAHINCGGTWRMPTHEEWTELITECTWTWITYNGVHGRLVTGPNNNSIFLPAAGFDCICNVDSDGFYWSSSTKGLPFFAYNVSFVSSRVDYSGTRPYLGFSIRPVSDEGVRISVTGVSLNEDNLVLWGEFSLTATVTPSNATQPTVIWSSSNTAIAKVDYCGHVTAVSAGDATITATTHDGGFTATCAVTVTVPTSGKINGYDWVDLGLTSGLKWATCNVGASAPEEYGDYFAWGETEPKSDYSWSTLAWYDNSADSFTKYCTYRPYGIVDNNTVLDPEDDAATVNWGGTWRMPTSADWGELLDLCTWTWTTQNGVNGRLVTSNTNGNSIFLPAAGYRDSTDIYDAGSFGFYWSSSLNAGYAYDAVLVNFLSSEVNRFAYDRYYGRSVRPVTE